MKGYRTIVFNIIMAALMMLSTFGVLAPSDTPDGSTVDALLDHVDALIASGTVIVNLILRFKTDTKVGSKS